MKQLCAVGAVLAAALLSGCVVAPIPSAGPYYGEPVAVAPPPLQVEYPGPSPVAGYVWIGGYWNWYGGRHVWVPGRWDAPRRGLRLFDLAVSYIRGNIIEEMAHIVPQNGNCIFTALDGFYLLFRLSTLHFH